MRTFAFHFANAKVKIRQKFISFLFVALASRRRPRGLQIRIKNATEAKRSSNKNKNATEAKRSQKNKKCKSQNKN
jgi:hypothetical protein